MQDVQIAALSKLTTTSSLLNMASMINRSQLSLFHYTVWSE